MLTDQEIYDKVKAHLLAQGRRSMKEGGDPNNDCLYRGPDGTKCAAGALIDDHLYSADMEGFKVRSINVRESLVASGVPYESIQLIQDLQYIHDERDPNEWEAALVELASNYGLNP